MSSSELHTLHRAFTEAGGHWSTFLIWAKDRFTLGHSDYQRQFEPILYGGKEGQSHYWIGARNEGDVWFVPKPKSNRLHPTMKPVALAERAIRNSSRRGDLVLDVFAGVGSTLIACEKASRRAAVLELDSKYADVIVRRWEAYTHREAKLLDDGRTFSAIAGPEADGHGSATRWVRSSGRIGIPEVPNSIIRKLLAIRPRWQFHSPITRTTGRRRTQRRSSACSSASI